MFAAAVLPIFLAALAQSVFAATELKCARSYTIKQGDICDSISKENNVSTFQLAAVNSDIIDDECSNLIPGGILCLGHETQDCATTYVVRPDDTCEGIASAHQTNVTILHHNNPQINPECDNIYIGEVLCVAPTVIVPPVPAAGLVIPVSGPPVSDKPIPTTTILPSSSTTAAPAVTPANLNNASTNKPLPVEEDEEDDDEYYWDCDGDDGSKGSNDVVTSPAAARPATTTSSQAPATTSSAAAISQAAGDDEDLPYCDEIEE